MTEDHEPARGSIAAAENCALAAPNQQRCEIPAKCNIGSAGAGELA